MDTTVLSFLVNIKWYSSCSFFKYSSNPMSNDLLVWSGVFMGRLSAYRVVVRSIHRFELEDLKKKGFRFV